MAEQKWDEDNPKPPILCDSCGKRRVRHTISVGGNHDTRSIKPNTRLCRQCKALNNTALKRLLSL